MRLADQRRLARRAGGHGGLNGRSGLNGRGGKSERSGTDGIRRRRRGVVLVLILVVVVVLALAAYTFNDLMLAHLEAAIAGGGRVQQRLLVESGVEYVRCRLGCGAQTTDGAADLYDNRAMFEAVRVIDGDDLRLSGTVSVVAPCIDENGLRCGLRYGLEDESGRLHLGLVSLAERRHPGAGRRWLMQLPEMTPEVADAILDWMDDDDEVRSRGSERGYYEGLDPPFAPANRPPDHLHELLMVRGITSRMLFGDNSGAALASPRSATPRAGWARYLTTVSKERHFQPGDNRIDINQPDLKKLSVELRERFNREWEMFIIAYRQNGPTAKAATLYSATSRELDLDQGAACNVHQLLDLMDVNVEVTLSGDTEPIVLRSPFSASGDPSYVVSQLFDHLVVSKQRTIAGRLNILTAPAAIVRSLPTLDPTTGERIVRWRDSHRTDRRIPQRTIGLLIDRVLTVDQMRDVFPFINVGGDVFRAHVVANVADRARCRAGEVVFDRSRGKPRVIGCRFYDSPALQAETTPFQ